MKNRKGDSNPGQHAKGGEQENLKTWVAEPPTTEQATVSGSYRIF